MGFVALAFLVIGGALAGVLVGGMVGGFLLAALDVPTESKGPATIFMIAGAALGIWFALHAFGEMEKNSRHGSGGSGLQQEDRWRRR